MTRSGISVIIPAYNRAALIGHTLRSLLNQTLPADEIIVVDDGSTDSTVEAAKAEFSVFSRQSSAKGRLPEFKVIRQENAGPAAARNRGLAESRGEFIHFLDSDDIAAPNKHHVQVHALRDGADIAYGPCVKGYIREHGAWSGELGVGTDGGEHGAWSREQGAQSGEHAEKRYSFEPEGHVLQQRGLPKGDLIKELLTRWTMLHACMFRYGILAKVGGYPSGMFVAEDQMLFLRCLLQRARVVHTPRTITFYCVGHQGKLSESPEAHLRRISDWARFLMSARQECLSFGIDPARWFRYRERCWRAKCELDAAGEGGGRLASQLAEVIASLVPTRIYGISATWHRWCGGAKARLMGSRDNASFRTGLLTAEQMTLFRNAVA